MITDFIKSTAELAQSGTVDNVGRMYKQVAISVLKNWNNKTDKEAVEIVNKYKDWAVLDHSCRINGAASVKTFCDTLEQALMNQNKENFFVYFTTGKWQDTLPYEKYQEVARNFIHENREGFYRVIIKCLEEVHNRWCKDNVNNFTAPERIDKTFQFLPLTSFSLDKYNDVVADYIFGYPLVCDLVAQNITGADLRATFKTMCKPCNTEEEVMTTATMYWNSIGLPTGEMETYARANGAYSRMVDGSANEGIKSAELEYIKTYGAKEGSTTMGYYTLGYAFKNLGQEPIRVKKLTYKGEQEGTAPTIKEIQPYETVILNKEEALELLSRPEYRRTITGGGKLAKIRNVVDKGGRNNIRLVFTNADHKKTQQGVTEAEVRTNPIYESFISWYDARAEKNKAEKESKADITSNSNAKYKDIKNYIYCRKKQYSIHACMPPKNTYVVNKLEQPDTYNLIKGWGCPEMITPAYYQQYPQLYQNLEGLYRRGQLYKTDDTTQIVLAGTVGELWTVKGAKLASTYNFMKDGKEVDITPQIIESRKLKSGILPWTVVSTKDTSMVYTNKACQVPTNESFQVQVWGSTLTVNHPNTDIGHGEGDFMIIDANATSLDEAYPVNGLIFYRTYELKGNAAIMQKYKALSEQLGTVTIDKLPKIFMDKQ